MGRYKLVRKHEVEHHNRYYELRMNNNAEHPYSLFFITDEENLEEIAAEIRQNEAPNNDDWTIIPHRKDE